MASEAECSGCQVASEDIAVCRSSAASEAALSSFTSAPESADNMQSQSDVSASNFNPQLSETDFSAMADGTAHNTNSWRVNIDNLPDEMLLKIFSHMTFNELLDVVQKVCSRWRRVSRDVELWANKEYHIGWWMYKSGTSKCDTIDKEAIQTLRDTPNLRKVIMHRGAKSCFFRALYRQCHRLAELRLHFTQKLSYSVLKHLVENCSRIHTLNISSQLLKTEKFSEAVSRLQHLRLLELEEVNPERPALLRPLGEGCPRLTEVDFGYINVDMDDLRHFLTAKRNTLKSIHIMWAMDGKRCVLPLLTVCADSLERLQLYNCEVVPHEAREAFAALGTLKNLQELRTFLLNPPPPGTAALAFKSGGLPKLRLLDLRSSNSLDNETIIAICRGCPALRELDVRGAELLSDAAFSQVYRLQHLEILDISCCRGLGGALMPCLTRLPRLHTLFLDELNLPKFEPGLTSILELSSLRCLTLNYSVVTGMPFDKFPGKLVSLRELHIHSSRDNHKVTDELTEQMPDLKIHGSIRIVDDFGFTDTEDDDSDGDIAEEENEENGVPANEENGVPANGDGAQGEGSGNGCDTRYLNENEGDNVIWDESSIHLLFLEDV